MDDSLEQPSTLRYVETRTTTGEQTQNRISDERLAKLAKLDCPAAHWGDFQCHLCERRKMARELTALRASHKRLVEVAGSVPFRFAWCSDSDEHGPFCRCGRRELTDALAEARKLEGK